MKIVHLVCTFPPYSGGMGNSVKEMVERLALVDPSADITIVCPNYGLQEVTPLSKPYSVRRCSSWLRFGNAAVIKGLKKIWQSADIIHLHYPFYGTDAVVWHLKKRHPNTKLVIHYHMDSQADGWKGWIFKIWQKLFLKKLLTQAEAITCASLDYWHYSSVSRINKLNDKLFIVPFTVDTDLFQPRPKDQKLLEQYGLKSGVPIILMVGGLDRAHYFKGVPVLLSALAKVKATAGAGYCQGIIVGEGDLRDKYCKMAKTLGLAQDVVFIGKVEQNKLPAVYNLADLFVLPSINSCEAFGLVLLEAMASGLPCLASNLPGVRQVIDPPHNGLLIEPNNVDDLANKISQLLTDDLKLKKMAQASRQRAIEYFSSSAPSSLVEIYHKIMEQR